MAGSIIKCRVCGIDKDSISNYYYNRNGHIVSTKCKACLSLYTKARYASIRKKKKQSKYKGVSWSSQQDAWVSRAQIKGTKYYLGRYKTEKEAAVAYDNFITMYYPLRQINFAKNETP